MFYKNKIFHIVKNSTLPEVKFPLNQMLMEKYDISDDMMENVGVTFSMINKENGIYEIANKEARLRINNGEYNKLDNAQYTLTYRFSVDETKNSGLYEGEFKLDFLGDYCGKITFPNDGNRITIIITESITKTELF